MYGMTNLELSPWPNSSGGIRESLADVQTGQLRVAGSHDGKHRLILRVVNELSRHHALNLCRRFLPAM